MLRVVEVVRVVEVIKVVEVFWVVWLVLRTNVLLLTPTNLYPIV